MEKKLRFAPIIRVSTERQEKQGESLRTQKAQIIHYVNQLGGVIPDDCWKYSGQEHATSGFEREKLDQLLEDASKGIFDAVIVVDASRWSRDNIKSHQGLEILKENKISFFANTVEYDLYNPQQMLFLEMSTVIGAFHAKEQSQKSTRNRIERAKRGIPTGGALPFGRTFNKQTNEWGIDPEKQRLVERAARDYIKGESLKIIAKREGMDYSTLLKVLKDRCGDTWKIYFDVPRFKIKETVDIKIPRLLDDQTIEAVKQRSMSNRTTTHGHYRHKYLLSRMVICDHCGEALSGSPGHAATTKYYRHRTKKDKCVGFYGLRADELEGPVMTLLFSTFGDKKKIEEAAKSAIPNLEEINKIQTDLMDCENALSKIATKKNNVFEAIANGIITNDETSDFMQEIRERESLLTDKKLKLQTILESVPDEKVITRRAQLISQMVKSYCRTRERLDEMTFDEKRAFLEEIFSGKDNKGKRHGVYLKKEGDRWRFTLRGNLIEVTEYLPMSQGLQDAIVGKNRTALGAAQNRGGEGS